MKWNQPTALLFGTLPQSVGQTRHALHRHMPLSPFRPSDFDEGYPDSGPCDYCISISGHRLAIELI